MRRLTTSEIVASLRMIFGPIMFDPQVAPLIPTLPAEPSVTVERPFDNRIQTVENLELVATAIAQRVVRDPANARAVLDCDVNAELAKCRSVLLDRLLRNLFRRPLTDAERASYTAFMDDIGGTDGVEAAITRALISPHFHQHLELDSTEDTDGRRRISPYATVSRVTFALTGTTPDTIMLDLAAKSTPITLDALREQAMRLIDTGIGHEQVRNILLEWLKVGPPDPSAQAAVAISIADSHWFGDEAQKELVRFLDYVVFEKRGSFTDLWTNETVFPSSDRLAKVFGVSQADGPVKGAGAPRGLFFRPATLMTSQRDTSPIVRGATLRRRLLCESFPTPDPALVAAGNAIRESLPATEHSGRERSEKATSGAACQTCHARINAVGFALEGFGPLGEWRTRQLVLDDSGKTIASFPIDSSAADLSVDDVGALAGTAELAPALASSASAKRCFAERIFASSRLRPSNDADACIMRSLVESAPTKSVLEAIVAAIVNDDVFYRAEVKQ